jgi:hypothetical protein
MLYCLMAVTRFVFFILLGCSILGAEEIPQLKAKAGMPVIQELMGGCSLTCAFPWEAVTGTSTFGGGIAALNDADSLTAWTNAQIGDTLIFKFPSNLPRELNGTPFYGVDIANGRLHPESGFKEFGRIKTIRLCHNNQPLCTIHLADTRRWQHVAFPDVYLNLGDTLAIEVLDTYPGKKEQTAAITEIVLQGAH